MSYKHDIISAFPFLQSLNTKKINDLLEHSVLFSIEKNKTLFDSIGSCSGVPMIIDGIIRLYKISEDTGREITLHRIGRGEICLLAAVCLISTTDYRVISEAESNCTILKINADYFLDVFHTEPIWQTFIFKAMAKKLLNTMDVLEDIAFTSIEKRVANYLYHNIKQNKTFTIKNTHEKIANELGTAREVVSRQIKDFEKQEILIAGRGKITITNYKKLLGYL